MIQALANALDSMRSTGRRRDKRRRKQTAYFAVQIAWLHNVTTEPERLGRLALIANAARGDAKARDALAAITERWQSQYGRRSRFGSVQVSHIDAAYNGTSDVFGDRRTAWLRFATWVALRAATQHGKRQAMRASYSQVTALAHGYATIADATAAGLDTTPQRSAARRTERSIKAFAAANMVLQWRGAGFRTCFYSYRLANPETPRAIAAEQNQRKQLAKAGRAILDATPATPAPVITEATEAQRLYDELRPLGWHDRELVDVPAATLASIVTDTQRIAGRNYVRLSRYASETDRQTQRAKAAAIVGQYFARRDVVHNVVHY